MQIQPLASILSDTSTATDPFNDVSSGNSPKPDHTTTPFDDLQLFIGIGYKHTRYDCLLNLDLRIYSTVDDFVLLGDRNRVLYYDSTNFTLNKIVELPNVSYIMQHHVIQNFLIILTKCQRLLIIDAFSGLFFTEIELFQPFVSFQEIISLDDCGFNILLKANGSFCQIVTFDLHSHRLLLKSSIIYPRFRPVHSLSIQDTFFYLFDKHGDYQVVIINGNNYHLLEATPNKKIFLDASFGLLRSIERLSPGKIIFLQDKGFSVFELRCTEKVSLNSLELFMYSLLPFSYSKFIQIQGIGYILMNGGYLMQIRENNTIVIKPEGRLLDIIPSDNFVLGIFEHYGKVARCLIGLEWSASTAAPIVIQENRPVYQDEKMVISYEKDNFVFRDQKGNEIITISSISETLKVVDLSPILQHDSSPYYYILVDHKGVVRFLVYNLTINPHFIKCIDIGNFDTDTILSLSYWEDTKTIEFRSTDEEKILNLRSLELIPRQKNLGSRLLIFKSRCLDIPALEEFFEKAVSVAEQLTLTNKWVIAQENNMNVFQRFTSEGSLNSPELMLLCKIYNKSHVDFHSISLVENVQRPISLVLRLGQLFGSSEQLIVDYAMYLVSEILVSLPSVLPLIVSIICSRKLTTRSSILLMLCFSICSEIVPANKALYLIKCAYLLLLKNQRAMKKVALDALKVLSRKDFRVFYTSNIYRENKRPTESLDLFFNIINTIFSQSLNISFHGEWDQSITASSTRCVFVLLNLFGYRGVLYCKRKRDETWKVYLLKRSKRKLTQLGNEINNRNVNVKLVQQRISVIPLLISKNPIFIKDSSLLAILNFQTLSIEVWDLKCGICIDRPSEELLRADSIKLKIPDFYYIMLQYMWSLGDTKGQCFPFPFEEKKNTNLSLSPRKRYDAPDFYVHIAETHTVYEPVGEIDIGVLLHTYLEVFPEVNTNDISLCSLESHRIDLTISGKPALILTINPKQ